MNFRNIQGFSILAVSILPVLAAEPGALTILEYLGKGGGYAHVDGPGAEARFRWPTGLAVDGAGRAYVTDQSGTIRRIDLDGTVTTYAGVPNTFGRRDGPANQALFSSPRALVADADGNLYVADEGNHTIRKISAAGDVTTVAGEPNVTGAANGLGAAARFNLPRGLALDTGGNLYVADQGNRRIRKIDSGGVVSTFAQTVGSAPEGLEFDLAGNLIVADWGGGNGGRLFQVTPAGVVSALSVTGTPAFSDPTDVARDTLGNLVIADTRNECIRQVSADRTVTTFAGLVRVPGGEDGPAAAARFRGPRGVAFAPDGSLWVADTENNAVRRLQPDGATVTVAGLPTGSRDGLRTEARFSGPGALALGPDGSLWIADSDNHTVRQVDAQGKVVTRAGSAGLRGTVDGPGAEARFAYPNGIAVTKQGIVYVADSINYCIRRRELDGTVATLAGKPGSSGAADGQGDAARFDYPGGMALDPAENLIVADTFNHTIRKVAADGTVSTLTGLADQPGTADGPLVDARFREPRTLTVAPDGTVFVADSGNATIRRIGTDGVVTTLAGLAGTPGSADGIGAAARFSRPAGLGLDSHGNLYVADRGNRIIRRISPDGTVVTVAGQPGRLGSAVGIGSEAQFFSPAALVVDVQDRVFIADASDNVIRLAVVASVTPPLKATRLDANLRLAWPASGSGLLLERAESLGPAGGWTPVAGSPAVEDGEEAVLVPISAGAQFFRLIQP